MANIKVGDKVVAGFGSYCAVKRVTHVNPNTLAVEGEHGFGGREPRQRPDAWRIAEPETVEKVKSLFKEAARLQKEANELLKTLPKVAL